MATHLPGSTSPTASMIGDPESKLDPSDQFKTPAQSAPVQYFPELFSKANQILEFCSVDPKENVLFDSVFDCLATDFFKYFLMLSHFPD